MTHPQLRPRRLGAVLAIFVAALIASPAALAAVDEVEDLVAELKKDRDRAEPERVVDLADVGTREAMQGLIEVFDSMGSIYMRREVIWALASFDGNPEAEQPALEKIMNIATSARERELRDAAIEALGESPNIGKHFLKLIVKSPANDTVREKAMEAHIRLADKADHAWYQEVYKPGPLSDDEERENKKKEKAKKRAKKRGEEVEEERRVNWIGPLRTLGFLEIVEGFDDASVEAALNDRYYKIRGAALLELERRGASDVLTRATDVFEKLDERPPDNRVLAAQVLARAQGADIAGEFMDQAEKFITPHVLRNEMADLLAAMDDPSVEKKLQRKFGKGKRYEKLFYLRACRDVQDPKFEKKLFKQLKDKEAEVVIATCAVLAARGNDTAVEPLRKLVEDSKDAYIVHAAFDALATLRDGFSWEEELEGYARSDDVVIRNLALRRLAASGKEKYIDELKAALGHEQWSTRLAALEGLESYRRTDVIPAIIEQMEKEDGRMQIEFSDALWRMTGKPFERNVSRWQAWWKNEGEGFELISAEDLAQLEAEREERRLRATTKAKSEFFGIKITSHRVIFILDVSGSMNETLRSEIVGQPGEARLTAALRELLAAIEGLDEHALFNIIVFSSDNDMWVDGVVPASPENLEEAKEFVGRLGAGGGTNLYGSLRGAFDDPDVDTIYLLSDGEPSVGDKTDPTDIREEVARWNEQRKIVINTIAVGAELQILEWLAEDSAGSHVEYQ